MRTKNFLALAVTAMALTFAGCSNDKDITEVGPNGEPLGELVDAISISFGGQTGGSSTRVMDGSEVDADGTEANIYEAFVFAKEMTPSHDRPLEGDWTVIRVTNPENANYGVLDDYGRNMDKTPRADMKPIVKNTAQVVENAATFKGVRQGDFVYVIANDPTMTLEKAEILCHKGPGSETSIKEYTANLDKSYVGGLTYVTASPVGQFIMAGKQQIQTNPTVPSNGALKVKVGLDRELAKVNFKAQISDKVDIDEAAGRIAFKEGDGVVVARIARNTSMFMSQTRDFYVPADGCNENWPINAHTKDAETGVFSLYCDNTAEGSEVFDGESDANIAAWPTLNPADATKSVLIGAEFNKTPAAEGIDEYRYSWKLKADAKKADYIYMSAGVMIAPMFYTTPNYSAHTNSVTVIATQASYIGETRFKDWLQKYVNIAMAEKGQTIEVQPAVIGTGTAVAPQYAAISIANPIAGLNTDDLWKTKDFYKTEDADLNNLYAAALLQYRIATRTKHANVETDGVTFDYPDATETPTDVLLTGATGSFKVGNKTEADATAALMAQTAAGGIARKDALKLDTTFGYIKDVTKVYYRADVADYDEKNVSTRKTERNVYYQTVGTITSLGATSLHEAIYSESNSMTVDVTVNKWKLSVNQVPM